MTFKEYINRCNDLIKRYPKCANFECVYATDDEGNEYGKVYSYPGIVQIEDLSGDRFLELVGFFDDSKIQKDEDRDIAFADCSAIIIN